MRRFDSWIIIQLKEEKQYLNNISEKPIKELKIINVKNVVPVFQDQLVWDITLNLFMKIQENMLVHIVISKL